jgi:hypothetical protein
MPEQMGERSVVDGAEVTLDGPEVMGEVTWPDVREGSAKAPLAPSAVRKRLLLFMVGRME